MLITRVIVSIFSVGLLELAPGTVSGQDFPNKPIRIVTAAAGGGSDTTARLIAQGISGPLGQPVIVENRPTFVAIETVAKAPPDGYTLLVTGASFWINPLLQKLSYDAVRDFAPISLISREVFILAVHPSMPVKSVKELIALAKARPGELNFGSSTPGGPGSLGAELLKSMAGVNIVNVPYKGNIAAVTALVSGEIQLMVADMPLVVPHVKSGKLRALAVTSAESSALVPGLPTVAASGLPGYGLDGATGSWAPAKTPTAIINRLNQEIVRFLNQPDVKERILNAQAEVIASSPEQFAAIMKSDIAKWSKVIKDAGIKSN